MQTVSMHDRYETMRATLEKLRLSEISPSVIQSEIRAMTMECDRIGGVNLAQGVCDTEVPHPVVAEAIEAIHQGKNIYTRLDGIAPLREAIARKLERDNALTVDPAPKSWLHQERPEGSTRPPWLCSIRATKSSSSSRSTAITSIPLWLSGSSQSLYPLATGDWALDIDRLRAAITPKTRAVVINSPSNPCGKVFSREELEAIAEVAEENDLFLFTDEMYEYFVYDGKKHISPATLPGMAERTISISGLSKTFSITGWRIGYLTANARWLGTIAYFHDLTYVCAPSPFQYGAAAGLMELPVSFYTGLGVEYQVKRDMMCSALADAGLTPSVPEGAYYVLADASSLPGATAKEKARTLLRERGVAAVAGTAFFTEGRGENILRFCFAKRDEDLKRACDLLRGTLRF